MMEMLWMIEPWHWLVLGFLLLIVEMFVPTFASLWFGAAAIIVAALAWLLPVSVSVQIIIWLLLSAIFLLAWFKFIKPLSVDRTKAGLGGSVIVGETGMIIVQPQPDRAGMVRFSVPIVGAAEWMCRTRGEQVAVGDRVVVTDIVGNELIVSSMTSKAAVNQNTHV
ncbi:NfeD family protein [Psychrobacter glacincola]|uniref:NfeD family protein n=1 Tax=Psychrobacter glacincola TaxID=56810 RepID=A0ABW1W5B7_9GAMM|nr:NfeD family protein [Psychrobacter glacincola]